jgi:hypothetical protein
MKNEHIISIVENAPISSLSDSELATIRSHSEECADCKRVFEAAQISSFLLKERADETIEPSPFFQTRVLAALRERQAGDVSAFQRFWNASRALVYSMTATVAALTILTVFSPGTVPTASSQEMASAYNSYSAEEVLLDEGDQQSEQMSYEQVLTTLYESEEDR